MTAADYGRKFEEFLDYFNEALAERFSALDGDKTTVPALTIDAMKYAVEGGGKRVRPVLCFAANEMLGGTKENVKEFAVAIELIHSYSLVHDDLPAMDNDDYRRGKLSTHKKFGEAFGILAGDALLNYAFETCLSKKNFDKGDLEASRIIAGYAGYKGMISGQILDLLNEKNETLDEKVLYQIYVNKTSKLLTAPLLVASVKNGNAFYKELKEVGTDLGIMFQIKDDILDEESTFASLGKTLHKDKAENKYTSVKTFGLNGAKQKAFELYEKIVDNLKIIPNSGFLIEFTKRLYERDR